MNVHFNGEEIKISHKNLFEFMEHNNFHDKKGIALALNNIVIPKNDWSATPIKENDNILIITASAGG